MNRKMVAYILGRVLFVEALLMLPSVLCGLICREHAVVSFLPSILIAGLTGAVLLGKKPRDTTIYAREGFCIVALSWVLLSMIGAIPLLLCGHGFSVWDSFFEIVSGFTTTGATVISDVEALPKCILFWRSFTHWVGGMGVLVFALAVIPMADNRSLHLMRAEVPGPEVGKLVPRMRETAKILYGVYSVLTVILILLLLLGGMPLFDSLCTAFGAAGTGGFSVKNIGIMYYDDVYLETVIAVFMLIFGVNFNLFYLIMIRRVRAALQNEELRWYMLVVTGAVLCIACDTLHLYESFGQSLRYAFFQVSSIVTTTGYATADFANDWPQFSQHVLVLLMIIGACAGSTGGGLKVSRLIILVKTFSSEVRRLIHPRMVSVIRLDGKALSEETTQGVRVYFTIYMLIIFVSTLLISLNEHDLTTNLTAVLACFNNIGPGLGEVGPLGNYAFYSPASKILLSFDMLLGRLEIYPLLVLFSPSIWKRSAS